VGNFLFISFPLEHNQLLTLYYNCSVSFFSRVLVFKWVSHSRRHTNTGLLLLNFSFNLSTSFPTRCETEIPVRREKGWLIKRKVEQCEKVNICHGSNHKTMWDVSLIIAVHVFETIWLQGHKDHENSSLFDPIARRTRLSPILIEITGLYWTGRLLERYKLHTEIHVSCLTN
jgi:hypothetical protein